MAILWEMFIKIGEFWTTGAKSKLEFENKIAKMRKMFDVI